MRQSTKSKQRLHVFVDYYVIIKNKKNHFHWLSDIFVTFLTANLFVFFHELNLIFLLYLLYRKFLLNFSAPVFCTFFSSELPNFLAKKLYLLPLSSIFLSIFSLFSLNMTIACSKILVWINAFWLLGELVLFDWFQYLLKIFPISFCAFGLVLIFFL